MTTAHYHYRGVHVICEQTGRDRDGSPIWGARWKVAGDGETILKSLGMTPGIAFAYARTQIDIDHRASFEEEQL